MPNELDGTNLLGGRTARVRNMGFAVSLLLALTGVRILGQVNPASMPPAEAYKAAMAPFNAAKAQPDDLTDADKFALGIGMAAAARDCQGLSADIHSIAVDAKELLALSELCIFGQQYEPARATLVTYLALPQPPERKLALVLLIRALLGLNEPDGADLQVDSLLRDYPYDAQIHFAIDQVIDAEEAVGDSLKHALPQALKDCATQNAVTLPLLTSGKALEGKEISASPSVVFADAIRCAALAQELRQPSGQDMMRQLNAIAQQPSWSGKADLAPMQAAFARQQMVGTRVPQDVLHGHVLRSGTLVPHTDSLAHGTMLLVAFTLWAPSALDVVRDLARLAPQQPIRAITSWRANTGRDDVPSNQILMALRSLQQSLPPHVSVLIVPDAELIAFHADSFPAGIVIRDGIVRSNSTLSSRGAERMLLRTLSDRAETP